MPEDDSGLNSDLYLSDISDRDKPWDEHRANASAVQVLYRGTEFNRYSERIQQCSRLLGFALEAKDSAELKLRLRTAQFCRVRYCPVCQWRRSMRWKARMIAALPGIVEAFPKHRWLFLTLTVANMPVEELRAALQDMNKGWHRMIQRKQWPAVGFIRSTEVTRSKIGEAHPHFHCLLLVKSSYFGRDYLTKDDWIQLWRSAMRLNYDPSIDIKVVKSKGSSAVQDAIGGVLETLKYSVKESDLLADSAWLVEMTRQLRKTRAVSVGGVLKDFLKEEEPEDLVGSDSETDEAPADAELWFGWREMVKKYVKTERC